MLYKTIVMGFIIRYVEVVLHNNAWILIIWVRIWIFHPWDMHKYCAIIIVPMHRLNLILDFKTIILGKVNYRDHSVIWEWLKAIFELLIFPLGNKVVPYKVLQLGFKYQRNFTILVYMCNSFNFFFSSPFLLTTFSMLEHF
jgi:hypothetical protein